MRLLPLEAFFSDVSVLLTVIALDSPLIFLFPPFFQEAGSWGKGWLSSPGSLLIGVFSFRGIHSGVLPLRFGFYLSGPGPIHQGIHGVWVTGRLVLRPEGVEGFHPALLLTTVFEVDPFGVACQGGFFPLCIVARAVQSQRILIQLHR